MLKSTNFDIPKSNIRIRFYTAKGGVSSPPYQSLNCGYGSNDHKEKVVENRNRVASDIGIEHKNLISVHQYHSADVVDVSTIWPRENAPKADGMVTTQSGIGLGILTADCGPVLFADPKTEIIAAVHSGWRGAVSGVNERAIGAMIHKGAALQDIQVFIGPMIEQGSYEVGQDVFDQVIANDDEDRTLFEPSLNDGKFMFDLPGLIERRLQRLSVGKIHKLSIDTYANEDEYFSYRRNTHRNITDYGRGISVIAKIDV